MTAELHPSSPVDRRMALAYEWDELAGRVRQLDDFQDFLRPPRLKSLLPAAPKGPVVLLNVSGWRCEALLVRTSGVTARRLEGLPPGRRDRPHERVPERPPTGRGGRRRHQSKKSR
ncbi:hypothetical protein ACGFJ7_35665 [Actinoplanes sp. NPDC048988]|uniref:hypothetical protein n=1 Tax=Actinoplanes sp. NPDC048988 TaxID=3363901 RepID=UPI00371DFBCF